MVIFCFSSPLNLLNVDNLSNVNEMRIKVLSSYVSGHVQVRCSVVNNIALMQWKAVVKAIE